MQKTAFGYPSVHWGRRCRTKIFQVMKLTALLLTLALAHAYGGTHAQNVTISGKDLSYRKIFAAIEKQTGYVAFGNKDLFALGNTFSLTVYDMPLKEVLDLVLKDQPFMYDIQGKTIFISRKPIVNMPEQLIIMQSPEEPVKGIVQDSSGHPLAGATVMNKRTKRSVQTNAKGQFDIAAEPGDLLTVSYIGFENRTLTVQGKSVIAVMQVSRSPLDVVQVQAYGTTSRRIATGNIVTIKGADIARQPVSNPILALSGRVPNLVITPASGLPNAPVTIQLRGQNSLSTQSLRSEPLIIVDGVPFQNTLSGSRFTILGNVGSSISALSLINPADIEQIDVLTDADATSIYGSRGGNGVILITTKKGKAGPTRFNAGITLGNSRRSNRLQLLNTEQYLAMRREAFIMDGMEVPHLSTADKNVNNFDLTLWDPNKDTDWQDVLLGNSTPYVTANASVSGGSPTVQYLIGGTFNKQRFVFPGENKYETGTGNFSISGRSPNSKLHVGLNGSYTINNSISPVYDLSRLALRLAPNAPALYKDDGTLNWEPNPASPSLQASWTNPLALLDRTSDVRSDNLRASANISYEPFDNLVASVSFGYSQILTRSFTKIPLSSYDPSLVNLTGTAYFSNITNRSYTVDPQLTYKTGLFGGTIDLLVGASLQGRTDFSESFEASGYTSDALLKDLNGAASVGADNNSSQYKYAAAFGRATYNYNNRYILNLSGRRDGSSRFGPGYQFGNFWSVGAAWIFSNEWLVKERFPFLSFGKLRGSVGTSGQDGISDYRYLQLYETMPFVSFHNMTILSTQGAANPDYHWESIRKLELGLELGFFNDRLVATSAWWRNRAGDQLGDYPLPATGGANAVVRNMSGLIQNSGWDFLLTAKIVDQKNFGWTISANYGIQNNKLLSIPDPGYNNYGLSKHVVVGKPFSGFVILYKSKGLNSSNGLYQFVDLDGNITTDQNNNNWEEMTLDIRPKTVGITSSIRWGRFSLDCMVQLTKQMGLNYLFSEAFLVGAPGGFSSEGGVEFGNMPIGRYDYWRRPGQEAAFQKLSSFWLNEPVEALYQKAAHSDLAYVDASFIRLRNISLSWSMPDAWAKKLQVAGCQLFATGQNLLTITDYDGLDPETQQSGIMPLMKTITAGIQVSF
jgi:TonB-linked SusC/RagA family outer membrane protein